MFPVACFNTTLVKVLLLPCQMEQLNISRVSIQLLLRFYANGGVGSEIQRGCFNTTLVKVLSVMSIKPLRVTSVSIQLLLRFYSITSITRCPLAGFNTTLVKVLYVVHAESAYSFTKFQYNSC